MNSFEIRQGIANLASEIGQCVRDVHINQTQCDRLQVRVQAIASSFLAKTRDPIPRDIANTVHKLLSKLQACRDLILRFSSPSWAHHFIAGGTHEGKFAELNEALKDCAVSLQLDINIQQLFDKVQDKKDAQQDLEDAATMRTDILSAIGKVEQLKGINANHFLKERMESFEMRLDAVLNPKSLRDSSQQRIQDFGCEIPFSDLTFTKKIGAGGFGEVWQGKWGVHHVAIKKLLCPDFTNDIIRSFEKEVFLMRQLSHQNVITLYGACYEPGRYCIVMPLVKSSLFNFLHQKDIDLPWSLRWRMAHEIALGMDYLYFRNPPIYHRDLKSPNILVDEENHVRISDFGLSKMRVDSSSRLPGATPAGTSHTAGGTMQWTAPELMQKGPQFDEKCDVYSYGMVLWEIATREIPWQKEQKGGSLVPALVVNGDRPDLPPDAPNEYLALIQKCWAQKPDQRPTFNDIVKEIEKITSLDTPSAGVGPLHNSTLPIRCKMGSAVSLVASPKQGCFAASASKCSASLVVTSTTAVVQGSSTMSPRCPCVMMTARTWPATHVRSVTCCTAGRAVTLHIPTTHITWLFCIRHQPALLCLVGWMPPSFYRMNAVVGCSQTRKIRSDPRHSCHTLSPLRNLAPSSLNLKAMRL
eukprot:TRINITY_DN12065_c0_g1::TRINITY_DN12065_c0_g1_i1::g.9651::m.9651 TRINITY_DN12065_c0_g1::TRINITY_DN12065_c0_g1_i1::g.9651  ORF type:complete len:649 (-),score=91.47,sp/Q54Y55/SHKC_DICDI/39.78/7e-52,Pkinase_Tyr/PF07714.12/9.2e-57,Pkinase/PF00069.20/6.9e-53,APH/PF01636.18/2.5e+03,APH/PF01636.18/4.9e+03,APH/PF01636.18/0.77,APH/PF01636.18/3.4e+03 TRINITY_DN12065_c0_g1_i1:44-1966(-)